MEAYRELKQMYKAKVQQLRRCSPKFLDRESRVVAAVMQKVLGFKTAFQDVEFTRDELAKAENLLPRERLTNMKSTNTSLLRNTPQTRLATGGSLLSSLAMGSGLGLTFILSAVVFQCKSYSPTTRQYNDGSSASDTVNEDTEFSWHNHPMNGYDYQGGGGRRPVAPKFAYDAAILYVLKDIPCMAEDSQNLLRHVPPAAASYGKKLATYWLSRQQKRQQKGGAYQEATLLLTLVPLMGFLFSCMSKSSTSSVVEDDSASSSYGLGPDATNADYDYYLGTAMSGNNNYEVNGGGNEIGMISTRSMTNDHLWNTKVSEDVHYDFYFEPYNGSWLLADGKKNNRVYFRTLPYDVLIAIFESIFLDEQSDKMKMYTQQMGKLAYINGVLNHLHGDLAYMKSTDYSVNVKCILMYLMSTHFQTQWDALKAESPISDSGLDKLKAFCNEPTMKSILDEDNKLYVTRVKFFSKYSSSANHPVFYIVSKAGVKRVERNLKLNQYNDQGTEWRQYETAFRQYFSWSYGDESLSIRPSDAEL